MSNGFAHRLDLPAQEVHVWHADVPATDDAERLACDLALMSPPERERHARFVFAKDRRRDAVARALVRRVLSRYADMAPERWEFAEGAYGRPEISCGHAQAGDLRFNLTHSQELVVLVVARGRAVGIDTESTDRDAPLDLAERYFAADEAAALRALPSAAQPRRFWALWTLKESYIKARGMGLSLPLHAFSFDLRDAGRIGFRCDEGVDRTASRWAFCQWQTVPGHLVTLCVERVTPASLDLVCRRLTSDGLERRWHGEVAHASGGLAAWRVEAAPLPAR